MEVARAALRPLGLLFLTALTLYLGWRSFAAALHLGQGACANPPDTFPGWAIVVIGLAAFGAGHLTARYRAARTTAGRPARDNASDVAVHVLLALFFLAVVLILVYETVGLLGLGGLQPITLYVRCAKAVDPRTTTIATAAVCFVVGHWLWYPDQAARRRR